jgi:hypothetical protein
MIMSILTQTVVVPDRGAKKLPRSGGPPYCSFRIGVKAGTLLGAAVKAKAVFAISEIF